MRKVIASAAVFSAVVLGAAIVQAEVFDPDTGSVTVMASGGTVYENHTDAAQDITGGVIVASISLTPGRYEITGKTRVNSTATGTNIIQCGLTGLSHNESARASVGTGGTATLAVLGTVDIATPTDIELFCNPGSAATATSTVLQATTVSAIVSQ